MKRLIGIAAMMMFAWSVMAQNGPTLSEDVSRMMSEHAGRKVLSPDHDGRLCAFVRLRNAEGERLLSEQHCEVVACLGDILIVNIPLGALPTLAASQAVDRIETHLGGRRMNDVSQEWLHTAPLHQGSAPFVQAYDGQGVLVGIVDVGLDVSHPTFLSADGSHSRVVRFLDQYAPDDETLGDATSLGREYFTADDIAAKQHSADVSQTHGTHCLGTAVGSGFGSPYRGVAYGADVFAVASQGVPGSLCSANEVALMKHIFDYADEHQQPCVITYSSGYDYRDTDNELFQEAMGLLTGPGRIIVAAAGNKIELVYSTFTGQIDLLTMCEDAWTHYEDADCCVMTYAAGEQVANVFREKGWDKTVKHAVLADDLDPIILAIKDGTCDCSCVQGQYQWGYVGCQVVVDALDGKMPESDFIETSAFVCDASNVEEKYPNVKPAA